MTIQATISIQSIIRNGYTVNTFKYIPEFSKNQKSKLETTDMKNNSQIQGLQIQLIKIGTTYLIPYNLRAMSNIYIYTDKIYSNLLQTLCPIQVTPTRFG